MNDVTSPIELMIILPYYAGDRHRIAGIARIMDGFQEHWRGGSVTILTVPRFDCPPDEASEQLLSKKFRVVRFNSPSSSTGYPQATNTQFIQTFLHICSKYAKRMTGPALWMEPDMLPCRRDWIERLSAAWASRNPGVFCVGHIFAPYPDGRLHLNGGALYSPLLVKVLPALMHCDPNQAFDWVIKDDFVKISQDTAEIRYRYNSSNYKELPSPVPSIIHHCKDDSLLRLVASRNGISLDPVATA